MSKARLINAVHRLGAVLARMERDVASSHGMTPSQMRCLLALRQQAETEEPRVGRLAETLGLAFSTVTRNLAHLERRGWISRQGDGADKRAVRIALTGEGRSMSGRLYESVVGKMGHAFRGFHASEHLEQAVAVKRVAEALEKA